MSIDYYFTVKENYLEVVSSGKDDSLFEVLRYGTAILRTAITNKMPKILCDERKLVYNLKTFDNFNVASHIASIVPKNAKIAIVTSEENLKDYDFWETVAVNRGLQVKGFLDIEKAEEWLCET